MSSVFRFRLEFPDPAAAPREIAGIAESLGAFLEENGVPPPKAMKLAIAAEELLTNLAKYGDAGGSAVAAEGAVTRGEESVVFRIDDNSSPFDPHDCAKPDIAGDPMERGVGGLGLFMLFEMFDECRYTRREGGNTSEWVLSLE